MSFAGVVKLSSLSDLRVLRVFAVRLKLVFFTTYLDWLYNQYSTLYQLPDLPHSTPKCYSIRLKIINLCLTVNLLSAKL